ncbi:MAG: UMP kinase [Deltaproteobacteria bacterium]|nr:UMP kinase [Deltaproteobacteria bacterium]
MSKKYTRVLLKLSGEMFGGESGTGFDYTRIERLATQAAEIARDGVQLGLVVGGGNIYRGARSAPKGMDRVTADHMGMLATVINAICLQDFLERMEVPTRVMAAIEMRAIAEPYIKRRADRHMRLGRVVIFAAGTGSPFFTTDTAAALRASEMNAQVLIKGTMVDGVYDKDPKQHPEAVRFERLSYSEVLNRDLKVMDSTAVAFCKDNRIPILVLDIDQPEVLIRAVRGDAVGTLVGF